MWDRPSDPVNNQSRTVAIYVQYDHVYIFLYVKLRTFLFW